MAHISEHYFETERHKSFYLAAGPVDGPKIFFLHGWPELSLSWRHQLKVFGGLGFRAIAPDMRGYGKSCVYTQHSDYALREVVEDMRELHAGLAAGPVLWVGHDWGSPVVWSIAKHSPELVCGLVSLCVPMGLEEGLSTKLINRKLYPKKEFPAGQWDYMLFYLENFDVATEQMESNPGGLIKMMFRKGDRSSKGTRSPTASTRANGGWFIDGGFPDLPLDEDVLSSEEFLVYEESLKQNGFLGPNSWYMNHELNREFSREGNDQVFLDLPVLFIHAEYDLVCETVDSELANPMREKCKNLTEEVLHAGHWIAQEKGAEVSAAIAKWLVMKMDYWPVPK